MSTTVSPPTSTKLPRVADYARLSSDDVKDPAQRGKSVTIQLKACARHRAKQPDWAFVQSFQDNDIAASAYGKKEREDFDNLMALVRAGGVEIILCTEVTRLFRKPLEAEILIDLVWPVPKTTFHTIVTTRGGHYDLRTSAGRKALRDAVNAAAGESVSSGRSFQVSCSPM